MKPEIDAQWRTLRVLLWSKFCQYVMIRSRPFDQEYSSVPSHQPISDGWALQRTRKRHQVPVEGNIRLAFTGETLLVTEDATVVLMWNRAIEAV
jgi:hypothetical protein